MKRLRTAGPIASFALLLWTAAASAHHSVAAYYDTRTEITMKGVVTKIEWTNPHAFVYIDVRDERGAVTNWAIETDSPNVLSRGGWSKRTLKPDDQVTVTGY